MIDALAWWLMAIPSMRQPHWVTDFLLSLGVLLPSAGMLVAVVLTNVYEAQLNDRTLMATAQATSPV